MERMNTQPKQTNPTPHLDGPVNVPPLETKTWPMLNIGDAGKRLDTMVASFKGLLENADYTTEEGVWLTYVIKIMDEILIKGDADTGKIFREINNPEGRHTKTFETAIKDVEGFLQGKEILFKKGN